MSIDVENFLSRYNSSRFISDLGITPQQFRNGKRTFEGITANAVTSNTSSIHASIISYLQQSNHDLLSEYLGLYGTRSGTDTSIFAKEAKSSAIEELSFIDFTPPPQRVVNTLAQ